MLQLAVLASGNGSNFQAIMDSITSGALHARVCLLICNKPNAYVLERAKQCNVPSLFLDPALFPTRQAFDAEMIERIRTAGADSIALAGYMRLLTPSFLEAFAGRVLNVHPSLLPSFSGLHGAADALTYGVRVAGCTVHFVDEEMDSGSIIIQAAVPVHHGEPLDDLKDRIHRMEHRIYPQALQWLAKGRLQQEGRCIRVLPPADKQCIVASDIPLEKCLVVPALEKGF